MWTMYTFDFGREAREEERFDVRMALGQVF